MKLNNTILTTTSSFAKESDEITRDIINAGFKIVLNPWNRKLKENELLQLLETYKPVGLLAGTEPITETVLKKAQSYLKVISRVGAGWENVDRNSAEYYDIRVYRTRGVLTQAVAELTIGLILSALRCIPEGDRLIRKGQWRKPMGSLLQDKTVGIIGFGDIGKRVAELLHAFGSEVIFHDLDSIDTAWAKQVSLSELLVSADIISIHASGNKVILGFEELNKLNKKGIILVNTARGGLIDEKALQELLITRDISCACLDVYEQEPYNGKLSSCENVILTPHIGSYAKEARIQMEYLAVKNLLKGLREAGVL